MKIDCCAVVAAFALAALAGCQIVVDEPAKHPAPPPPPAATAAGAVTPAPAPKEVKVTPMHLHGAGAAPAGGGTAPSPAACLDTGAATAGDCAAMQPATACPATPTPVQKCNAYKTYFAPKVAAAAVACVTALTSAQLCDGTSVSACGKAALAQACPAPGVTQLCQIASGPCKTTATDCAATVSGLGDQGQQAIAQCVAQGCGTGLSGCIDGLAAASTAVSSKH
jgi:hypothetical protein